MGKELGGDSIDSNGHSVHVGSYFIAPEPQMGAQSPAIPRPSAGLGNDRVVRLGSRAREEEAVVVTDQQLNLSQWRIPFFLCFSFHSTASTLRYAIFDFFYDAINSRDSCQSQNPLPIHSPPPPPPATAAAAAATAAAEATAAEARLKTAGANADEAYSRYVKCTTGEPFAAQLPS